MRNTLDIHTVANCYTAQLQLYCSQRSSSYCIVQTIHAHKIASGFKPHHILNCLMDIYCKSSNIAYASQLFNKIPELHKVARMTLITALYYKKSKGSLGSIWWNPTWYARHCFLQCNDHRLFPLQ